MDEIFYFRGDWGGPRDVTLPIGLHGLWNACSVFDGARSIRRRLPDLMAHCERLVAAAPSMLMEAPVTAREVAELAIEGVMRFEEGAELYITPLIFSSDGGLIPNPETTEFMLSVRRAPLATGGMSVCTGTGIVRPAPGTMQTAYKTSWLYANAIPARKAAVERGFDDAVMEDPSGAVVEFSTANLWLVKDGVLMTPEDTGSILPGITRARVLSLLADAGIEAREARLTREDLAGASELFSTGNNAQIRPVTRVDERALPIGPVYQKVHDIYWSWLDGQTPEEVMA